MPGAGLAAELGSRSPAAPTAPIAKQYSVALQLMKDLPYAKWRDYDAEDTVRFYGLRLHEIGMVRSHPKRLVAQGTVWRFVDELQGTEGLG